jgi:hypothetical protein
VNIARPIAPVRIALMIANIFFMSIYLLIDCHPALTACGVNIPSPTAPVIIADMIAKNRFIFLNLS